MKKLVTPKQVAQALGVSESSVKRWCDQDRIPTIRTAGGHRRLPIEGVVAFLRDVAHQLVRPEVLGLPPCTGQGTLVTERAAEQLRDALVEGDEQVARQIVFDLYLARHRISEIYDQVVAPAFVEIGRLWSCDDVEVYQERRACAIALRFDHEMRELLLAADGRADAPKAVGGTLEGDFYQLPTAAVELVLRENGWAATSLGASLPVATLQAALATLRPRLFWLSVSHVGDPEAFLDASGRLFETASAVGAAMVVGGYALNDALRRRMRFSAYGDNFVHIESFLGTLLHEQ